MSNGLHPMGWNVKFADGFGFTVTTVDFELLQLLLSVTIKEYVVVTLGLTIGLCAVTELISWFGDHRKLKGEFPEIVVLIRDESPIQILKSELFIIGNELTLIST